MRECEALRGRSFAVAVVCVMDVGERTSVADLRESAERAAPAAVASTSEPADVREEAARGSSLAEDERKTT